MTPLCVMQGASNEVDEALDDKDEAFEFVTALLDDTLEQADAAVDAAKRALEQGQNPAFSQVTSSARCMHVQWQEQRALPSGNAVCKHCAMLVCVFTVARERPAERAWPNCVSRSASSQEHCSAC